MSDVRIKPINPPYSEDTQAFLNKWMLPNVEVDPLYLFRVLIQNPDLASRMRPLASGLLGHGLLEPNHRELLILRTCSQCNAEYEWGVHATAFSQMVGLTPEQVDATVNSDHTFDGWTDQQAILIQVADALLADADLDDTLWEQLSAHWITEHILEILTLVGWYRTISTIANVSRIPLETWAKRFPQV